MAEFGLEVVDRAKMIRVREVVEHPLDKEPFDMEAWRSDYTKDAYTDQLGLSHWANIVYERIIIHIEAQAEQFEYYGRKWYMSDYIGHSDDGRKWRFRAELVSYSGGGYWQLLDDPREFPLGTIERGHWTRVPYIEKGKDSPKGYMFPDGTPAVPLMPKKI